MDTRKGSSPQHARVRRIGKKAIFYGRLAPALGVVPPSKDARPGLLTRLVRKVRAFRPTRKQLIITAITLLVVGLATAGAIMYQQKRLADEKAAAAAEAARVEKANAAAQLCYQKKTAEKKSMLGKVTYDQLYDKDACTTGQ